MTSLFPFFIKTNVYDVECDKNYFKTDIINANEWLHGMRALKNM